jgi:hypothetical protein
MKKNEGMENSENIKWNGVLVKKYEWLYYKQQLNYKYVNENEKGNDKSNEIEGI